MDGHDAGDAILDVLRAGEAPSLEAPTMRNQTEECEQESFGHIDYDCKIVYSYAPAPAEWGGSAEVEEQAREMAASVARLEEDGWRFSWSCYKCPREYDCVNSIDAPIEEFFEPSPFCQLATNAARLFTGFRGSSWSGAGSNSVLIREPIPAFLAFSPFSGNVCLRVHHDGEIKGIISWLKKSDCTDDEIVRLAREKDVAGLQRWIERWLEDGAPVAKKS